EYGKVFVAGRRAASERTSIFALDLKNGARLWRAESNERPSAFQALEGAVVAVSVSENGSEERVLEGRDPRPGASRWRRSQPAAIVTGVSPGLVLQVDPQVIRALDKRSGEVLWRFQARYFEPDAAIPSPGAAPRGCPLGLEASSVVRVRDWVSQRL